MNRWIDVEALPAEVRAVIEGLADGEEVTVTRDGAAVAVISGVGPVDTVDAGADADPGGYGDVTVVATAMKLSAEARSTLAAELGGDYVVLDLRSAPRTADVVLVPPSSPQLIGSVRGMFPDARVIVTEIRDAVLGVSYEGPVRRMLNAGAETYLAPGAVPALARQLDRVVTRQAAELTGGGGRLAIER